MRRAWHLPAKVLTGILATAMYALPQANTISARPGAVNYIEGAVSINGNPLSSKATRATFLNANDVLSSEAGKAEVLLTPGVFLRLGENSAVKMISPTLVETRIEMMRGEAMVEVDELQKDNHIEVVSHGATTTLLKTGLYRFTADVPPTAAVLNGKATIQLGARKLDLKKGKQIVLAENAKPEKFDHKKEDELYAWSNVRSEYAAAASYQAAKSASSVGANGFSYGPGWYWANGFDTWAWLPGNGAFFSPFGWGFYGPGAVAYAPVVTAPVYRGGRWIPGKPGQPGHFQPGQQPGAPTAVPVHPRNIPPSGIAGSPWADHAARVQAARAAAAAAAANGGAGNTGMPGAAEHRGEWAGGARPQGNPNGGVQGGNPNGAGGYHGGYHGGGQGGGGFHGGNPGGGGGFHGGAAGAGGGGGHPGGAGGGGAHGGGAAGGGGHPR